MGEGEGTSPEGTTVESAVRIDSPDEMTGVRAEYAWLEGRYPGYQMRVQRLVRGPGGGFYDLVRFAMPDGTEHEIYFDIRAFFGKR